jgi:hypothetical protein
MQKSEGAQYYVVCTFSNLLLRNIKVSEPPLLAVASKIMQYIYTSRANILRSHNANPSQTFRLFSSHYTIKTLYSFYGLSLLSNVINTPLFHTQFSLLR